MDGQRKRTGRAVWFEATRPRTLPAAVAPVLVGSALAWRDGHFDGLAAGICLVFALLIQVGANFANDYYDFQKGADTAARVGPVRAVAAGLISPAAMRRAMWAVLLAAFGLGLSLIAWGGPLLIIIGAASVLGAITYTGGPFPLGYHGLGDIFVLVFFGFVAVGATYFVQAGGVTGETMLLAVPIGLLAANILVVNNYRDADTDRQAGKRTLVVRWGKRAAQWQHAGALLLALAIPVGLVITGERAWLLLPCALLPMGWSQARRLRESKTPRELIPLLGASGKLLAWYAALLSAGLLLARA